MSDSPMIAPSDATSPVLPGSNGAEGPPALQPGEQRWRDLLDSLQIAAYVTDAQGRIVLFNDAAARFWGQRPEPGARWCGSWRLRFPDGSPMAHEECPMAIALREGRPVIGREAMLERPGGERVPFLACPSPIHDQSGRVIGAINLLVDISERRRLEADTWALADSRSRLAAIVDSSEDAILSKDLSGTILSWNRSAQRIFGYRADEIVGRPMTDLIPPERRSEEEVILRRIAHGEQIDTLNTQRLTRDGRRIDVSATISPVRNSEGVIVGASTVLRDVTERRRIQAEAATINEDRSRLAAIVESSEDAILSKDLAGVIRSWNRSAERIFGYRADEIIGRSMTTLIPPERRSEEDAILLRVARGEQINTLDTQRLTRDGRRIDVSATISPVRGTGGVIVGASTVLRDISERKRAEADLLDSTRRLEEAVRARTAELEESHQRLRVSERMAALGTLSAGIGHDMGNLLLPLRIRLEALERVPLPAERLEDLAAIRSCAEYLQRLASSLRLLSTGEDSDADATSIARWWRIAEPMLLVSLPPSVRLEARIDPGAPPVALPGHDLSQLVFNLVQNAGLACAGRPDGLVVLDARAGDAGRVILTVSDNGAGMTEKVRKRCVEPFFTTRPRGASTGLGLSLVAGIVERAHASMDIDSVPGRGTRFSFSFRVASDASKAPDDRGAACVHVADPRIRAFVVATLETLRVSPAASDGDPRAWLLVTDAAGDERLDAFLAADPSRRAVVRGGRQRDRVVAVDPGAGVAGLRDSLRTLVDARPNSR